MDHIALKYGINPNQKRATLSIEAGALPLTVLNGRAGYINILDALLGWQLVSELKAATTLASAASFKHASPAGSAVAVDLNSAERAMFFIDDDYPLSEQATAFVRARGADRLSSFGDFIALSDRCDESTARLIAAEVSDGIIAPAYDPSALAVLKKKRKGSYLILQIDPSFVPPSLEQRSLFGMTLTQERNGIVLDERVLTPIVTRNRELGDSAKLDLLVALNTLKYTQSNSVCYAKRGQAIGVGAGQQSRIHCTRLAGEKADLFHLRQSERILTLPFKEDLSRNAKDNAIDLYLRAELHDQSDVFTTPTAPLTDEEVRHILKGVDGVSLASDAFFPFRDNIDRAHKSGVRYIVQAGGSVRDEEVIAACDEYDMVMICNKIRLFLH
ncbi:MAG: phosphoribosylaminoimidazolecarboxamide formyltransferase [Sphaerochaeta sp.]|nr:phosphoribosylaminoimidazolecarboxamide formyltransferase [Sphaerochaeta sp.]